MIGFIVKVVFLVFLVSFIRALWRSYKVVKAIRTNSTRREAKNSDKRQDDNIVEAEYRHLD